MAGHRFLGGAETVQQAAKGGEQGGDVDFKDEGASDGEEEACLECVPGMMG